MTCICSHKCLSGKWQVRTKTSDTCYIDNDFTNVTKKKVYEEYIELRTGSKHKKSRITHKKKLVFQKNK